MDRAIDDLEARDYAAAEAAAARSQHLAAGAVRILAGAMVASVVVSLAIGWRLGGLAPEADPGAHGVRGRGRRRRLERTVPVFSGDELGRLARAFNAMSAKLKAYRDAMAERVLRVQRTMEATLTSCPDPVFVVSRDGGTEVRNPGRRAARGVARLRARASRRPSGSRSRRCWPREGTTCRPTTPG